MVLTRRSLIEMLCAAGGFVAVGAGCDLDRRDSGGEIIYECDGEHAALPVTGNLPDGCADYFNKCVSVNSWNENIFRLVNECWFKEFGCEVDPHACVQFVDSLPNGEQGRFDITIEPDSSGNEIIRRQIRLLRGAEPFLSALYAGHEISHLTLQEGPVFNEEIPAFTEYRIGTMAGVDFPEFGKQTGHMLFRVMLGRTHSRAFDWEKLVGDNPEPHCIASLAVLLALNKANGNFSEAYNALCLDREKCVEDAKEFVRLYYPMKDLEEVIAVSPYDEKEQVVYKPRRIIAGSTLSDIVAHQVTKRIEEGGDIEIYKGMRDAARHRVLSVFGDFLKGAPPTISPPQTAFYSKNLLGRLSLVVVPAGYDNDIPRGI